MGLSIQAQRSEAQHLVSNAVALMQRDHYRAPFSRYVADAFGKYRNHLTKSYHRFITDREAQERIKQVIAELDRLGFIVNEE